MTRTLKYSSQNFKRKQKALNDHCYITQGANYSRLEDNVRYGTKLVEYTNIIKLRTYIILILYLHTYVTCFSVTFISCLYKYYFHVFATFKIMLFDISQRETSRNSGCDVAVYELS